MENRLMRPDHLRMAPKVFPECAARDRGRVIVAAMDMIRTAIPGVLIIAPRLFDERFGVVLPDWELALAECLADSSLADSSRPDATPRGAP